MISIVYELTAVKASCSSKKCKRSFEISRLHQHNHVYHQGCCVRIAGICSLTLDHPRLKTDTSVIPSMDHAFALTTALICRPSKLIMLTNSTCSTLMERILFRRERSLNLSLRIRSRRRGLSHKLSMLMELFSTHMSKRKYYTNLWIFMIRFSENYLGAENMTGRNSTYCGCIIIGFKATILMNDH